MVLPEYCFPVGLFCFKPYKLSMKKLFVSAAVVAMMASCAQEKGVTVSVSNPLKIDRVEEIVEISADDVLGKLKLDETAEFIIVDETM